MVGGRIQHIRHVVESEVGYKSGQPNKGHRNDEAVVEEGGCGHRKGRHSDEADNLPCGDEVGSAGCRHHDHSIHVEMKVGSVRDSGHGDSIREVLARVDRIHPLGILGVENGNGTGHEVKNVLRQAVSVYCKSK